jgi:hypothetical protein
VQYVERSEWTVDCWKLPGCCIWKTDSSNCRILRCFVKILPSCISILRISTERITGITYVLNTHSSHMGCYSVANSKSWPTFRRYCYPLRRRELSTSQLGVMSRTTWTSNSTAVRISNHTFLIYLQVMVEADQSSVVLEHDVVLNYWMISYATDKGKNKSIQNFVK